MRERYEGESGRERLIESLLDQELIGGNREIAREIAEQVRGNIVDLPAKKQLYTSNEPGNIHLSFILSGSLELFDEEGGSIAVLEAGQAVGEYPLVDPKLPYSVDVVARQPSVVARLSEERFKTIAAAYPDVVWRNMAKSLVKRLRKTTCRPAPEGRRATPGIKPGELTIGQLIGLMKPAALYQVVIAIVGAFAVAVGLAYKLGGG